MPCVNRLPWRQTVIPLRCRCPSWWICYLGLAAPQRSSSTSLFNRVGNMACCVRAHVWCWKCHRSSFRAISQHRLICPDNGQDVPPRLHASACLSRPRACVATKCSGRGDKHPNKPSRSEQPKPKHLSGLRGMTDLVVKTHQEATTPKDTIFRKPWYLEYITTCPKNPARWR